MANTLDPNSLLSPSMNRAQRRAMKKKQHIKTMAEVNSISSQITANYDRIYNEVFPLMRENISIHLDDPSSDLDLSSQLNSTAAEMTKCYINSKIRLGKQSELLAGDYSDLTSLASSPVPPPPTD